jgi:hypothetical protein
LVVRLARGPVDSGAPFGLGLVDDALADKAKLSPGQKPTLAGGFSLPTAGHRCDRAAFAAFSGRPAKVASTADAQSNSDAQSPLGMPFEPKASPPTQEQIERQRATDQAYEAAIQELPDKKSSADPWGDVRPAKAKSQ